MGDFQICISVPLKRISQNILKSDHKKVTSYHRVAESNFDISNQEAYTKSYHNLTQRSI